MGPDSELGEVVTMASFVSAFKASALGPVNPLATAAAAAFCRL
jgi:hypothetical protein